MRDYTVDDWAAIQTFSGSSSYLVFYYDSLHLFFGRLVNYHRAYMLFCSL